MSSSVSGRNACLSEEVIFTCTARGHGIFWWSEGVGEIRVHYRSSPQLTGHLRAAVESYDIRRNCLVSSLTLRADASRNWTRVMCRNRDRSVSQSQLLHIMSMLYLCTHNARILRLLNNSIVHFLSAMDGTILTLARTISLFDLHADITLGHLTVVQVSLSTVLLEWNVIPTDGHHCIKNYNIQVSDRNGSQWRAQIPGRNHSFLLSEMQLEAWEEYTYYVTANIQSAQASLTVSQKSIVEVQGMFHIT